MEPARDIDETLRDELAEVVGEDHAYEALRAYEEAAMQGLCHEGAWEVAVGPWAVGPGS